MNLYQPNPLLDSPFGPGDLEWLYRQQDVDGSSLTSRLAQLAPISFTNTIDGQRRRRLFALDTLGDRTTSSGPTTTRANVFPTNSRFTDCRRGSTRTPASPARPAGCRDPGHRRRRPSLAHRDKKINLNYPLPVSNDPNEPIRQKWISDTYQLLKAVLPPKAVDTAEELAQLSQFVINIIDFRDPDCTMTHWLNPDVDARARHGTGDRPQPDVPGARRPPDQPRRHGDPAGPVRHGVQPGRHQRGRWPTRSRTRARAAPQANRFFVELVNTLTADRPSRLLPAGSARTAAISNPRRTSRPLRPLRWPAAGTSSSPPTTPSAAPTRSPGQLLPIRTANYYAPDPAQPGHVAASVQPCSPTPGATCSSLRCSPRATRAIPPARRLRPPRRTTST